MSKYQGSTKISNNSEEEDYYFLQPMFEKHPPNEILSNKYAPDIIPQVKLMYLSNQVAPTRTNDATIFISFLPRQKAWKWKLMPPCSMFSIISASSMQIESAKSYTSSSITLNTI
jgi:hypothetical protein